jgi:hypothetical protein
MTVAVSLTAKPSINLCHAEARRRGEEAHHRCVSVSPREPKTSEAPAFAGETIHG